MGDINLEAIVDWRKDNIGFFAALTQKKLLKSDYKIL